MMRLGSLWALLLLGACAHNPFSGGGTGSFTQEGLLTDVDFIVAKIEEAHADPYRIISKPEFHSLADRLKARIAAGEPKEFSALDAYFIFQELAAAIQDEHTEMVFPYEELQESELYPPFLIGSLEDKLINLRNLGDARIPMYAQILEINGVSSSRIWEECRKFLNPPLLHAKSELLGSFAPFYLTALFDLHSPWTVRYRTAGSDAGTMTCQGITAEQYRKGTADSRQYRAYSLQVGNREIPALEIPSFSFGAFEDYKRFMDEFFAENKNKEALVIDLRRNPGGNGVWGYYMLDFLTDSPYTIIDEFIFKMSDVFLESGYRDKASRDLSRFKMGDHIPISMESVRSPHPSEDKFAGRVFLLVSHATDSAGVVTAAVFKHNKMGVTIGQETAGRIRFCSDPVAIRLPCTGLKIHIPLAIYDLPGEMGDRGVIPDITVPRTIESLRIHDNPEMAKVREILSK